MGRTYQMPKHYMAIDQYGSTHHNLKHPRKDLMERLNCKHASKMYRDTKNGKTFHVGYVIANHWLTVYEVQPMRNPA